MLRALPGADDVAVTLDPEIVRALVDPTARIPGARWAAVLDVLAGRLTPATTARMAHRADLQGHRELAERLGPAAPPQEYDLLRRRQDARRDRLSALIQAASDLDVQRAGDPDVESLDEQIRRWDACVQDPDSTAVTSNRS